MTMQEGIKKNNSKKDGNLSDVMETKENLDLPETLEVFPQSDRQGAPPAVF